MADIGLSAFSLFFMQSESFLSHQRRLEQGHVTSNCHTLFGMKKIPTDNYIRLMLDPVSPETLQPCFDQVDRATARARRPQGLSAAGRADADRARWDRVFLLAKAELPAVSGAPAIERQDRAFSRHAGGGDRRPRPQHGLPLMPEFIAPQDGAEKQDCERNGAKRWLGRAPARGSPACARSIWAMPLRLPAAGRGRARQRRRFSVRVQDGQPQDAVSN